MQLHPELMQDRFVRLEPLAEAHREGLRAACNADTDIWQRLYPFSWAGEHFPATWDRFAGEVAAGKWIAYAVVVDGLCQGVSCFLAIDGLNASVEIGATYYRPEQRGGPTNPAAKRLLLANAFGGGARRVVFNVDAINSRSRAAVSKLGAVQEGISRQDRICWTGRVRDTAHYSILQDEWPTVRDHLDARLGAFEGPAYDR